MSLYKGQIKTGKKKVKKRTIRFLFQRYLKNSYRYIHSEFDNKYKYEILEPIKIDNLEFFVNLDFNGANPKEIELRSGDCIDNDEFKLCEEWTKHNSGVDIGDLSLQKRSFRWGTVKIKLTKLGKDGPGCITIKIKYK